MKKLLMTALIILLPTLAIAAGLGTSAGHDLDALWAKTQKQYDLNQEDAVLLLESREVTVGSDATLTTRVHRVVWIGTAVGVRNYADLRIPWNSALETLDVEILRTWREGRWWPDAERLSDTAIVHTLPHALDRADDYTPMRETMLLHDGVELGCIMETAYTTTRRDVPACGDLFILPQADPAVLTRLVVRGKDLAHAEMNGAPAPQETDGGLVWQAEMTPALATPHGDSPELSEPAVAFSTWRTWQQLADGWLGAFAAAGGLQPEQKEALMLRLHAGLGPRQKAAEVGAYLTEMVRPVHYGSAPWAGHPRPASRTLATAYGHDLDRAVLAAALLDEAGIAVEPILVGGGLALAAPDIPRLGDGDRILLLLPDIENALLDPAAGELVGLDVSLGHPVWFPTRQSRVLPESMESGSLDVAVNLEKADEGWNATGHLTARGLFSPYSQALAGADLKEGYLSRLVASVAPGLELSSVAPGLLRPESVDLDFAGVGYEPQADSRERRTLAIGAPAGGVLDHLPHGVHLYEDARQAPVIGLGDWHQTVTVRIEVDEDALAWIPATFELENLAGRSEVRAWQQDGWLTVVHSLEIRGGNLAAEQWPALRALLLEANDPAHGLVLWK